MITVTIQEIFHSKANSSKNTRYGEGKKYSNTNYAKRKLCEWVEEVRWKGRRCCRNRAIRSDRRTRCIDETDGAKDFKLLRGCVQRRRLTVRAHTLNKRTQIEVHNNVCSTNTKVTHLIVEHCVKSCTEVQVNTDLTLTKPCPLKGSVMVDNYWYRRYF